MTNTNKPTSQEVEAGIRMIEAMIENMANPPTREQARKGLEGLSDQQVLELAAKAALPLSPYQQGGLALGIAASGALCTAAGATLTTTLGAISGVVVAGAVINSITNDGGVAAEESAHRAGKRIGNLAKKLAWWKK